MSLRIYRTNCLLWLGLSLLLLVVYFWGTDYVFALFSGQLAVADLLRFEFFYPVFASAVAGWLLQCAIVIVFSWKRAGAKQ